MPIPRRVTLTAAASLLALATPTATVALADDHPGGARTGGVAHSTRTLADLERPQERAALRAALRASTGAPGARDDADPDTFTGLDGQLHEVSPFAVAGQDGYYFIGSDFDTACAFGAHLGKSLEQLSKLADLLEKAGKRVLFTVAPNKSAVVRDHLPVPLPQGSCARRGMRIQADLIDRYRDPRYLPLRRDLLQVPHSYWHTDTHWSTAGTTVLARHLARALDPKLAQRLRYKRIKRTHGGDLAGTLGLPPETIVGRLPRNGVRSDPAKGSPAYDPSLTAIYPDYSWVSRPARRTFPGRTLVLGDSFAYVASEAVMNLFRKGQFMWVRSNVAKVARAVNGADTVVFSVVQRFATVSPLVDPKFQKQLKKRLH